MNDTELVMFHQLLTELIQVRQIIRQQEVLNNTKNKTETNVGKSKLSNSNNR